jgi:hypothetical protein
MARALDVQLPLERAYTRYTMLAVELLDAVSLERVTEGVEVVAKGLPGKPIRNVGGMHVWLKQDVTRFEKLVVTPRARPYRGAEVAAANVQFPLHVIELMPLSSYPFAAGTNAIRGRLIETAPPPNTPPTAVTNAVIRLEWLHDDGVTWRQTPQRSLTDEKGEFAAFLRLASTDVPLIDGAGNLSIRLFASRAGTELHVQRAHPQGRVADAVLRWDQMVP